MSMINLIGRTKDTLLDKLLICKNKIRVFKYPNFIIKGLNYENTILIFIILFSSQLFAQTNVDNILTKLQTCDESTVLVAAHRGDWRNYPENSLEGINSAIEMGVDIVELDLQCTKDSVLILMHDNTLDRTTTGKGNVSKYTLDEIRKLNLKKWLCY